MQTETHEFAFALRMPSMIPGYLFYLFILQMYDKIIDINLDE